MTSPAERYRNDLAKPDFSADPAQAQAVQALQTLYEEILTHPPKRGRGLFGRIHGANSRWPQIKGLYLWGGVGRGKTYLMDCFFDALQTTYKRRTHFHRFMLDIHARRNRHPDARDPLQIVASEIAAESRILCFDEFFISDIADAMILGRLLTALFARGVTLVATSNVRPDDLYKEGLQRDNFLPAIESLKTHVAVLNVDGGIDFRLRALHFVPLYLFPNNDATEAQLLERFTALSLREALSNVKLSLNDRPIVVERLAGDIAWFKFGEVCDAPRAAADYIELAQNYRVVIISKVPQLGSGSDDAARRFITLVDEFYDRGVKLIIGAEVSLALLYGGTRLEFEFERTRSRLVEMQSEEYLARPHA